LSYTLALIPIIVFASIILSLAVFTFLQLLYESIKNGMYVHHISSLGVLIQKIVIFSCVLAQLVKVKDYISMIEDGTLHGSNGQDTMTVT